MMNARHLFLLLPVMVPLCLSAQGTGGNLLANPGFEEVEGETPARWEVFVKEGVDAFGRLDNTAHSGSFSVMLHTPTPYENDPVNNWSQNIIGEFAGKRMRISGWLRTEDAGGASLWAQCWRRQPWGVAHVASTALESPVYGTRDWEEVTSEFEVPEGTVFITVRCVIEGTGTAWFDDIRLEITGKEEGKPSESLNEEKKESAPETLPDAVALPLRLKALEADVARLQEANLLLADTVEQTHADNQTLLDMVNELRRQVEMLNTLIAEKQTRAPAEISPEASAETPAETTPESPPASPPLVPYEVKELEDLP